MPTTIYDSSLITQRSRDKAIAQQIKQANNAGQAIITPQAGYGSYLLGEADNGNISYFRKAQGCTDVQISCNCTNQTTSNVTLSSPRYSIVINITTPGDYTITLNGSGHIYWGDGIIEAFDTGGIDVNFTHTYTPGLYTITIATYITKLQLSYPYGSTGPLNYPNVTSYTL
jgi:hypothetical protein